MFSVTEAKRDESYESLGYSKNDEVIDLVSCWEEFGGCPESSEGKMELCKQGNIVFLHSMWRMDKEGFCNSRMMPV